MIHYVVRERAVLLIIGPEGGVGGHEGWDQGPKARGSTPSARPPRPKADHVQKGPIEEDVMTKLYRRENTPNPRQLARDIAYKGEIVILQVFLQYRCMNLAISALFGIPLCKNVLPGRNCRYAALAGR